MNKELAIFGDTGIDKRNFHNHKNSTLMDDIGIGKILLTNKLSVSKKGCKYFIGCKDDVYKIIPLCAMLQKMRRYVKSFDETKYVFFY